jgi:hypothetical protein
LWRCDVILTYMYNNGDNIFVLELPIYRIKTEFRKLYLKSLFLYALLPLENKDLKLLDYDKKHCLVSYISDKEVLAL